MVAKITVENKKRIHMLLVGGFVHIILYRKDFVERVNSKDHKKMLPDS